jgi:hypothetical protein
MSKMMNCKIGLNVMDDYLGGYLDEDIRQALEDHLGQCASCQARFVQDQALRQRLQAQLTGQPKAGFADRVLERAVEHHQNKTRHHWSFIGGAIAASFVIAITSVLLPLAPQQDPDLARQTLALHQVTRVALAFESREGLKGATITLHLPDNVELSGFSGQRKISWKTDIDRGTNLLALPVMGVAAKNGLLVARLQYGNKSKEYKVELNVQNPDVNGRLDRKRAVVVSRANFYSTGSALSTGRMDDKEGNA